MDTMAQTRLLASGTGRFLQRLRARARDYVAMALLYLFLILTTIIVLYPLAWMVGASFKPEFEIMSARLSPISLQPTTEQWRNMLTYLPLFRNTLNSLIVVVLGSSLSIFLTSLGGYAFAKYDFPGNKFLFLFLLATMMVPGEVNLVPSYLIMVKLKWINTYWPLIVPGAASAFGIFLMRQYISSVPTEMLEAARMDGCGEFGIFWRIVLPVIRPALATQAILGFVGGWNDFVWPSIILRSREMYTLMVAVAKLPTAQGFDTPWGVIMAAATFAVVPSLLIFALAQRFFLSGITLGAVRG